jgi:hypothetical protein
MEPRASPGTVVKGIYFTRSGIQSMLNCFEPVPNLDLLGVHCNHAIKRYAVQSV